MSKRNETFDKMDTLTKIEKLVCPLYVYESGSCTILALAKS